MTRAIDNPWLTRWAVLTAACTLALIAIGGLVTSHGAGMAVPDWPTTYGYNMFLFPISQWVGGIFYEHTHRLWASFVGLLTTVLAVWLWLKESRRWLRWLGVAALVAVALQGVLGGLRVTLFKNELGIFHATVAQLFFVLTCLIALFTSRGWTEVGRLHGPTLRRGARKLLLAITGLIMFQLVLGATMRHQHAGLAVPDFPLAYGKLWPAMDEASLARYNRVRTDARDFAPVTAFQIGLHLTHRVTAVLILAAALFAVRIVRRELGAQSVLARLVPAWCALILLQALLGAVTVWSNKAADITTAHVALGALSLALGALATVSSWRLDVTKESAAGSSSPSASTARVAANAIVTA